MFAKKKLANSVVYKHVQTNSFHVAIGFALGLLMWLRFFFSMRGLENQKPTIFLMDGSGDFQPFNL